MQDLETFASSDALPDLLKLTGLGDADSLVVRDWKDLAVALDLREVVLIVAMIQIPIYYISISHALYHTGRES